MNYKALDEALEYLEEARVVKQYYDSNYYITNTKLEGVPVAVYKYKEDADKIDAGINAIKKNLTDIKASAAAQIWRYLNKHGKVQGFKDENDIAKKLKVSSDKISFYYELEQSGLAYGSFVINLDTNPSLPIHYSKDIKYDYQTKSLDYTHYSIMDGDKYNTY